MRRLFFRLQATHQRSSRRVAGIQLTSCCKKKFKFVPIFLDTEFQQIYTFVSCNFLSRSVDNLSIGRIGKWQPRKQPRKQRRRQPRRSNPTQRQSKTGDAKCVPRSASALLLLNESPRTERLPKTLTARSSAWRDIRTLCFSRCCSPPVRTARGPCRYKTAPAHRGSCPSSRCCGRRR